MHKMVNWCTQAYAASSIPHQTDSLFYLENVIRQLHLVSPFSIKFCLNGSIPYVMNREKITVPSNRFMLTNEGLELECLPCEPGIKALVVYFTPELLQDVCRNRYRPEIQLLDNPEPQAVPVHFFQHIYRPTQAFLRSIQAVSAEMSASPHQRTGLEPDAFFQLADAMFLLQADVARQIGRLNACHAVTREERYRRILNARDFMQDAWQSGLTLHEIARHACLSPFHFHRSFQEVFGIPPMKWFRQLKLEHARSMLASGRYTVTQVALSCGFADVFSFSKAYKRTWGNAPSTRQTRISTRVD